VKFDYHSDNYVVLDFEIDTSHGDFGAPVHPDNKMLLACWSIQTAVGRVQKIRWGSEYDMGELVQDILSADFLVAHNAKYELGWLKRCGMDLHDATVFCTQIAEYCLLGNRLAGTKATSLDNCVKRRGGRAKDPVVDLLIKSPVNPLYIPRRWLQGRCVQDIETTEELFLDQRTMLTAGNMLGVMQTRCIFTPVLAALEFEGMALDPTRVKDTHDEYRRDLGKLEAEFDQFTGGVNWRSPDQIAAYLYNPRRARTEVARDSEGQPKLTTCPDCRMGRVKSDVTKDGRAWCVTCHGTNQVILHVHHIAGLGFEQLKGYNGPKTTKGGKPLTDSPTMDALESTNQKQRDFLALRKRINKVGHALSKSLDFYMGVCQEHGGQFFAQFHQTRTATHRLSSGGIPLEFAMYDGDTKTAQFQNQPRIFKKLMTARRPGYLMGEWDGSGMEFRTAVDLGRDERGLLDITSGHDVHSFTASVLLGIRAADVTKEQRQNAKSDTFKPLYGGSKGTPAQEAYYKAFRERYPQINGTQETWVDEVVESKRLITPWGMRYYWPWAKRNSKSGYCNETAAIYNYPVQAFATAEIIPIAIVAFWQAVHREQLDEYIVLVNTVHDSVVCEVHPDYCREFERLAVEVWHTVYEYLREVYDYEFKVPFGTEIGLGEHWGDDDVHSAVYNIFPNGEQEKLAA
jgi:DNA polymerase I-like protein with 3'-5' exonuclease and polymerase domains